jgi:hypothetical protein
MSDNGHNGDGDTGHDPPPGHINLRLERCEQCGDVVVKAMTLGPTLRLASNGPIGKPSSAQWKITSSWTGCKSPTTPKRDPSEFDFYWLILPVIDCPRTFTGNGRSFAATSYP